MIQAVKRSSAADASPSTGNNDELSPGPATGKKDENSSERLPPRPTTVQAVGRMRPFRCAGFHSQGLAALTGTDGDRLIEIGNRLQDVLKVMDILGCEESLDEHATCLVSVIIRELDMMAAIAIQPMVAVELVQ